MFREYLVLLQQQLIYHSHIILLQPEFISFPQAYYTYGRMLVKLAEAIGRLVLAGREMSRLAGK